MMEGVSITAQWKIDMLAVVAVSHKQYFFLILYSTKALSKLSGQLNGLENNCMICFLSSVAITFSMCV